MRSERLDMSSIIPVWNALDQMATRINEIDNGPPTRILTQRASDEAQPAGPRTYIAASRAFFVGYESLRNLRLLLSTDKVTPLGPLHLVRPIFEGGFYGVYILEPNESLIRRRRGLSREIYDDRQQAAWLKEFAGSLSKEELDDAAERQGRRRAVYTNEAVALKTTYQDLNKKVTVIDELRGLETLRLHDQGLRETIAGAWRFLSACDHGLGFPTVHGTQVVSEEQISGGVRRIVVADDQTVMVMVHAASYLLRLSGDLYLARSTTPI